LSGVLRKGNLRVVLQPQSLFYENCRTRGRWIRCRHGKLASNDVVVNHQLCFLPQPHALQVDERLSVAVLAGGKCLCKHVVGNEEGRPRWKHTDNMNCTNFQHTIHDVVADVDVDGA
jgi:hypothetical protein